MSGRKDDTVTDEDDPLSAPEADTGDRFDRYRAQRRRRGLNVPTWGEYLESGQPLYDDD